MSKWSERGGLHNTRESIKYAFSREMRDARWKRGSKTKTMSRAAATIVAVSETPLARMYPSNSKQAILPHMEVVDMVSLRATRNELHVLKKT